MEMAFFNLYLTLFVFTFLYLSRDATATYLVHSCSNKTTFSFNSTYQSNLLHLLSSLSSNARSEDGFYNKTVGQNAADTVYGLFLCRGDLSVEECQYCVTTAAQDLTQRYCPIEKEAVIWYDDCMLRYSDQYFFSDMSTSPSFYMRSGLNITDPDRFKRLLTSTMNELKNQVANVGTGAKKFATKQAYFRSQNLYTLVQCTPDISNLDCSKCIKMAMSLLDDCCVGIQGARTLFPSCIIRYETYRFYAAATPAPAPAPAILTPTPAPTILTPKPAPAILAPEPSSSSHSPGKQQRSPGRTAVIGFAISLSILLPGMGYYFLKRRARKKYNSVPTENAASDFMLRGLSQPA